MLVEFVVGSHWDADFEMFEKNAAGARVLSQNQVHLLQDAKSSEGYILKVADGCRNEIERTCFRFH